MLLRNFIIRKCLLTLLMTSALSTTISANTLPITYFNALELALTNHPRVQAATSSIDAAIGGVKRADSMHWPQLEFDINGARSNNPMSVFGYKLSQGNARFADFGASEFTGLNSLNTKPEALNHPGYYNNFDTAFQLTLPVYSGGKILAQQAQMKALVVSAEQNKKQIENQLAYEIYASYERFLTANQLVDIAQRQVVRAKEFLSTTQSLNQQSITLESDVLMAESYLNNSLLGLSNAKIQTQNELDRFNTLLANPATTYIPRRHTTLSTQSDRNGLLMAQVLNNNPSIQSLHAHFEAEKAAITATKALYLPQVSMQYRYDWNGNTFGSGLPSNTIALDARWTLWNGGESDGAVQVAIAEARKIQFELDEQRNQLELQLKQIHRAEQQAEYELQMSRQIANKEEKVIQKLKQRFDRGLVPLSALLESQMKLTQSQSQELQAQHQLRIHHAQRLMLNNQLIPNTIKNT